MQIQQISDLQLAGSPGLKGMDDRDAKLMVAARDLEATFLSEMLKHAGVGKTSHSFGGGIGEEQFSSLLREAQAKGMVEHGGIGLAEAIFQSLKETPNDR